MGKSLEALIIGGLGMVGVHLYKAYKARGCNVVVIDNCSGENLNNIKEIDSEDLVYCDIRDAAKLHDVLARYPAQCVYVLAAHFANQNSVDFPVTDCEVNVIGQVNIVSAISALPEAARPACLFYASSSCVYGAACDQAEDARIYPVETPYGINKFTGELYYSYLHERTGIGVVIGRLFNVYGPYERASKYRNVIPNFIHSALRGGVIGITGSGMETRDFTYAEEAVKAIISLTESGSGTLEAYNIGTGHETSIADLATRIIGLGDPGTSLEYRGRRDWDVVSRRKANLEKLTASGCYVPQANLEEGLARTVDWYRSVIEG